MRRLALLACLAALAAPSGAAAHPLGNFTVNRLAAVDLAGDRIYVRYVLDLAEIPTYQERKHVERAGYARGVARKLELRLDGRAARLDVVRFRFGLKRGAGGLETLRFEAVFRARGAGSTLELRDGNYANRLGWREMVVRARDGAKLVAASVPDRSESDDLRSYAGELLDVRRATASFALGTRAGEAPALGPPGRAEPAGGFEALIAEPGTMMLALLLAAFWGAAHALTPGHWKAIVAGYLVGSRGKPRHAVALGLIVTVTHTIGVFALGLVTLALSAVIVPEQLYPWLTLVSGLLVVLVGASVLRRRLRPKRVHHHHHHHEQDLRSLLGVGVAAGLLPCPSALVVLLSAIALHRIGLGLALIVAFSAGLAATITAIGLVAVLAQRAFARLRLDGRLVAALPAVSAALILVVGAGLTINALPEVL
ncbi:MAG TPA: sulfite exporter TauE/SafE family protein [Gaiellaceae bacterium]|nr:sulfite exporter TauE/SafE family protein [Gaiellaceae bacterium]